jgi:hypothetical protein
VITFEQARQIVAASPTMLELHPPGTFRVERYGWENSRDFLMAVDAERKFIPGDHILVSKRTGKLRLVPVPGLPWLFDEPTDGMTPIGDVPE